MAFERWRKSSYRSAATPCFKKMFVAICSGKLELELCVEAVKSLGVDTGAKLDRNLENRNHGVKFPKRMSCIRLF